MPHKPVVKQSADASAKPQPLESSINECMHTGPPLQPLLWDILVWCRVAPYLLLRDIGKAFLQISLHEEDRNAFRFLFNLKGKEEHFRFTRVPFGVEANPFLLGEQQCNTTMISSQRKWKRRWRHFKENTYVDNLMKTGSQIEDLERFKEEATHILESAKFPVHKGESNVIALESENMQNPGKILGHTWNKINDTLVIQVPQTKEETVLTKKVILSQLGRIYDPLGIISPTLVEGKRIYARDEGKGWNSEVSVALTRDWNKWANQLQDVPIPRSLATPGTETKAIDLHLFVDGSAKACSTVAFALLEQESTSTKGSQEYPSEVQP